MHWDACSMQFNRFMHEFQQVQTVLNYFKVWGFKEKGFVHVSEKLNRNKTILVTGHKLPFELSAYIENPLSLTCWKASCVTCLKPLIGSKHKKIRRQREDKGENWQYQLSGPKQEEEVASAHTGRLKAHREVADAGPSRAPFKRSAPQRQICVRWCQKEVCCLDLNPRS